MSENRHRISIELIHMTQNFVIVFTGFKPPIRKKKNHGQYPEGNEYDKDFVNVQYPQSYITV